ncbi:DUF1015 family protein [Streptomyces nigrescens]
MSASAQPHTGLQLCPFRAVRYDPDRTGDPSTLICPPYDEIGPAHARALRRTPHHLARLLFTREPHQAARQLRLWLQRGVLVRDTHPALYVYQQQHGRQILQRGLIGELQLSPGNRPAVLPHEDVQSHVVRQRGTHMARLHAQLEPLLLTYRTSASAAAERVIDRATLRKPLMVAQVGPVTHSLWACTDPEEHRTIAAALAAGQALIADGHHRHAACRQLTAQRSPGPWQSSLALLVDSAAHPLQLTAIHRVLPGIEAEKAAATAADYARVRPLPSGPRSPAPHEIILTGAGRAWSVTEPRPQALDDALAGKPSEWREMPAAIADHLLAQAWSLPDLPGAVRHEHDTEQAIAAVAAPGDGTAVLLPAMDEDTVWQHARAGVMLPRKTTSFGPKPAAGLVLRVPDIP